MSHYRRFFSCLLALLLCLGLYPCVSAVSAYDRPGQKLLALTFDDGPGPYSDVILDVLAKHGAKATFFMNGYKVRKYSDQVKRMAEEGHQIANHTYNHVWLTKCSDTKLHQELDATAEALTEVTGLTGTGDTGFYLRPPYGDFNQRVVAAAGVPVIWCTVDSGDWKYQSSARLVSYTGSVVKDGDIVVMHEIHKSTAQGLDSLLDVLDEKGFEMVTLEDLFWRRGITPQAGQVYYSARGTGVDRCPRSEWYDESRMDTHWAWPAIEYVRSRGLLTGTVGGEFLPERPLTRGMLATSLGRLDGAEAGSDSAAFSDVPAGSYAAPYIAWAAEAGIMEGVPGGLFEPGRAVTRQELAVVLARYARSHGIEADLTDAPEFPDVTASWAEQDISFCAALGLMEGSEGLFRPDDPATRAMGAAVLARLAGITDPLESNDGAIFPDPIF